MGLDDGDKYDPPGVKVSSPGVKVSSPSGVAQCVALWINACHRDVSECSDKFSGRGDEGKVLDMLSRIMARLDSLGEKVGKPWRGRSTVLRMCALHQSCFVSIARTCCCASWACQSVPDCPCYSTTGFGNESCRDKNRVMLHVVAHIYIYIYIYILGPGGGPGPGGRNQINAERNPEPENGRFLS